MPSPERWSRIKQLFDAALSLPPAARAGWLALECEGDDELRGEVETLLEAEQSSEQFLDQGPTVGGDALFDALASTWAVGREIGAWRITRLLGHGGSGVVHLAERSSGDLRQQVALKLLRPGADTLDGVRRLLAEAQTLARLDHPGVARLIEGGTTPEGLPWLAMELVDGEAIDRAADRARLPISERLRLLAEVARTVGDLHRDGLIHRDLKPGNLFLDRHGRTRVLDLGLARWLDSGVASTATNLRRLTPSCAAPEQIRGEAVSPATDVWALGILLSRLLIDAPPWPEAKTEAAVLTAICDGPLLPPSKRLERDRLEELAALRSTTPPALKAALTPPLDRVVLACLDRDPTRRYPNGHALADDLERILAAREPSAPVHWRTIDRQRLRAWAPRLAALLLGVLLAAGWWHTARTAAAERARADALEQIVGAAVAGGDPTTCAEVDEALALGRDLGNVDEGCGGGRD